jgi:SpoVK/Ycf46/Vps4 family AAA+-type ATPase
LKKFFDQLPRPCIVFIDEIDVFVPSREQDEHGYYGDVINTLLQYLDGTKEESDILFLAATNRIDSIDPALLRAGRFDYKIFVDYPDFEARKEIWNIYLQKAYLQTEFQFL